MYTIAHILPYFLNGTGKWPEYIDWYMASCEKNSTIDFFIFTDDSESISKWKNVVNLHIIDMSFNDCVVLIHKK